MRIGHHILVPSSVPRLRNERLAVLLTIRASLTHSDSRSPTGAREQAPTQAQLYPKPLLQA